MMLDLAEVLIFILTLFVLFFTYKRHAVHYFSPISIYVYFFVLMYITRHAILMFNLDTPMPDDVFIFFSNQKERIYTLFCLFIWSISFLVALNVGGKTLVHAVLPSSFVNASLSHFKIIVFTLLLFTTYVLLDLVSSFGFDVGSISLAVRLEDYFAGRSFLLNVNVLSAYVSATFAFYLYRKEKNKKLFWFYSFISFFSISISILTADRDNMIFFFVFYYMSYVFFVSSRALLFLPIVSVASIVGIVYMQKLRLSNWGFDKEYSSLARQFSSGLNQQFYDSFILLKKSLDSNWFNGIGHRLGEDFYLGLIGIIPRSFWQGKPEMVDPGIWFSNQFIDDATYGWPISIVGEWWFNFSILGVIIGGFFSGRIYKGLNQTYSDFFKNPISFLFMFIIVTRVFSLGYSSSAPMYYVLNVLPLFMIAFFINGRYVVRLK
jgi:hypothetical protein